MGNGACNAVVRDGLQVKQAAGNAMLLCVFKDGSTMAFFVRCQLVTALSNHLQSNLRPLTTRTYKHTTLTSYPRPSPPGTHLCVEAHVGGTTLVCRPAHNHSTRARRKQGGHNCRRLDCKVLVAGGRAALESALHSRCHSAGGQREVVQLGAGDEQVRAQGGQVCRAAAVRAEALGGAGAAKCRGGGCSGCGRGEGGWIWQ